MKNAGLQVAGYFLKIMAVLAVFAGGAAGFSGCDLFAKNELFYFDEETFHAEWDKWKERDLQDYSYIITGYMHPYRFDYEDNARALLMYKYEAKVTVKNGEFDSYEYFNSTDPRFTDDPVLFEENRVESLTFTSISQMYQSIYDQAKEQKANVDEIKNNSGMKSFRFILRYDSGLHYPSYFYPSIESEPGWIWDTVFHEVTISGLAPLEGN